MVQTMVRIKIRAIDRQNYNNSVDNAFAAVLTNTLPTVPKPTCTVTDAISLVTQVLFASAIHILGVSTNHVSSLTRHLLIPQHVVRAQNGNIELLLSLLSKTPLLLMKCFPSYNFVSPRTRALSIIW